MAKPFESKIQDLVYNVDVGIGHQVTKVLLYVLFVLGLAVMYQISEFKGLKDAEAMDYAQVGRNLAREGRFTTQYVRPASMWYLMTHRADKDPKIMDHPDIMHPPVYPALLAGVFRLLPDEFFVVGAKRTEFRPEKLVILPLNHVITILTGIFVFLLGGRLFDRRIALLAMTGFFLSNVVWAYSISGTTISTATLMVTMALFAAVSVSAPPEGEAPEGAGLALRVVLCGFLCALAFLTRYAAGVVVLVAAVFVAVSVPRRGWAWALGLLLVFMLSISPWLARNKVVSGGFLGMAPHTALHSTSVFDDDTFERTFEPEIKAGPTVRALQGKWFRNVANFYGTNLRVMGDGLYICFFLAAFFFRFVRRDVHWFRLCAALGILCLLFVAGYFGERTISLLHVFLPVMLVYGCAFFYLLLDRLQLELRIQHFGVIGIVVALGAAPLAIKLLPPRANLPYPPYFPPFAEYVSDMIDEDEWMCSDMPWATAWYGHRTSLQLPVELDDFYKINDFHKRISGLHISTLTWDRAYLSQLARGNYRTWFPILHGQTPADFPLKEGRYIPLESPTQFFLTDRVRW